MSTSPALPLPSPARVLEAPRLAERICVGSAALFPTDTLPALAARPQAAAQIWRLKERPSSKPLILMGADPDALFAALEVPIRPEWRRMAEQWWPGALTLVLPASGRAAAALHPQARPEAASLGLRIPACPAALGLLRLTGPLATTSANRSGEAPCLEAATAAAAFPDVPLLGPCPWPEPAGLASTVIAWTAAGWALLRAGAVLPAGCLP